MIFVNSYAEKTHFGGLGDLCISSATFTTKGPVLGFVGDIPLPTLDSRI